MIRQPVLRKLLPFELTNGNEGRTKHFGKSAKLRSQYEAELRELHLDRKEIDGVKLPFNALVDVHVTRVLGPRQSKWDPSSIGRGNYKEIEDSLVACGWFHDDSAKWIRRITFDQDANQRSQGPGVIVAVFYGYCEECGCRLEDSTYVAGMWGEHDPENNRCRSCAPEEHIKAEKQRLRSGRPTPQVSTIDTGPSPLTYRCVTGGHRRAGFSIY